MQLDRLLQHLDVIEVRGPTDRDVDHVTRDSRRVGPHSIFVAIVGAQVDGHQFVGAVSAPVVVTQRQIPVGSGVTQIVVRDTKRALAQLAAGLHGHPSRQLAVVGITGTNGKTTIASLSQAAMQQLGWRTGRIGTTGNVVADVQRTSAFTTPEAPQLQGLFAEMREAGVSVVTMEVSSIGLDQRRVDGTDFALAVFTNLTPDHLGYHGSMEAYGQAKARLFRELLRPVGGAPRALLYGDDPAWRLMEPPDDHWLYGLSEACHVRATELVSDASGIRATLHSPRGTASLQSTLLGHHNALNLMAAFGILVLLGVPPDQAAEALGRVPGVAGRLERVADPAGRLVVVDYAHSEDALDNALRTLVPLTRGQLWVVFGCGGDRDASKRPRMGAVAAGGADHVVVTSDNPRSESPTAIIDAILAGIDGHDHVTAIPDRADAIAHALRGSSPDDTVLIAGKGHESYQEIDGERLAFDDRAVARTILEGM